VAFLTLRWLAPEKRHAQPAKRSRDGIDPVEDAKAKRSALQASRAASLTFTEAASAYIKAMESEWSNVKHAQQWRSTLKTYAEPVIGKVFVRDVEQAHILRVLEPIWLTKNETASRLRGRIESILDWSRVQGYRTGENPARWRGHLEMVMPKPSKVQIVEHHPALPFDELAAFMELLQKQEGMGARALEFAILTAARSGTVRSAKWDEVDFDESVWTAPAEHMKGVKGKKREHRVPLCDQAIAILKSIPESERTGLIFSNTKGAKLSDMTLTAVLKRMGRSDITAHGFRSTFRDWCSEKTSYPRDVAEMALAHTIGDKVEAAYRRGDLFEKRRRMMKEWGRFATTIQTTAKVTPIKSKTVA
jgi:integrase